MNKAVKNVLKILSDDNFDLDKYRKFVSLKAIDPLKILYTTKDISVENDGYLVPVRIYYPYHEIPKVIKESDIVNVFLFFHGGGFVTESVDTYNRICRNLSKSIDAIVVSVDYRLAPEFKFPIGLIDCYTVTKALYENKILDEIKNKNIIIIGDSAGGNIAAAVSMMARDKGEFVVKNQILIYPCTDNDYSKNSKYPSVIENGKDYLLTRRELRKYMSLYAKSDEDKENPYFSPIKAENFENMPRTLLITAEFDPLRDEGEAFGKKLAEAGNEIVSYRIDGAIHGFFAYTTKMSFTKQCMEYINEFVVHTDICEESGEQFV